MATVWQEKLSNTTKNKCVKVSCFVSASIGESNIQRIPPKTFTLSLIHTQTHQCPYVNQSRQIYKHPKYIHAFTHRHTNKLTNEHSQTHIQRQWECFLLLSGSLQWRLRFAPESLWSEPYRVCIRLASPPLPKHTHIYTHTHTGRCQVRPTNTVARNRVTRRNQVMQVRAPWWIQRRSTQIQSIPSV